MLFYHAFRDLSYQLVANLFQVRDTIVAQWSHHNSPLSLYPRNSVSSVVLPFSSTFGRAWSLEKMLAVIDGRGIRGWALYEAGLIGTHLQLSLMVGLEQTTVQSKVVVVLRTILCSGIE